MKEVRESVCDYVTTYIYIIYTPNLELRIAVSVREREQGRFRGSNEGARGSSEGAPREHQESTMGQEPETASSVSA